MNRKSAGFASRKSLKPRESQATSLVGQAPTSGKRGVGNRSVLDVTRSSASGSRQSLYAQLNQKDPRVLNDEFVKESFNRIRQFLSQKALSSDAVPNTSKLTLRQFENMFTLLFRLIEPTYNAPNGNNWMEYEVPVLMESLGYPCKVTKSMMQTVSSKPGPVVGILDYLLDMAAGMDCDPAEACRLLQNSEAPLQVETEELARASFPKGQTPQLKEQVLEMASRFKGVMDEQAIVAELECVRRAKQEAESELQLLTEQQAEKDSAEAECLQLAEYLDQMRGRQDRKQQEFEQVLEQKAEVIQRLSDVDTLIRETKALVEGQPISVEEIRSMRNQIADIEAEEDALANSLRSTETELETTQASVRVAEAELSASCVEVVQMLTNAGQFSVRDVDREKLAKISKDADEMAELLSEVTAVYDALAKKIAEARIAQEEQLFELDQRKTQLQRSVDYSKQDTDALQEK
ncbi:kinetochore protein NDC80-like, partial [Tropilaelaps mercedesae]